MTTLIKIEIEIKEDRTFTTTEQITYALDEYIEGLQEYGKTFVNQLLRNRDRKLVGFARKIER